MSTDLPKNQNDSTDAASRKGGRPRKGADKARGHVIYMDDALWAYCRNQPGGASVFLKQLALKYQTQQEELK